MGDDSSSDGGDKNKKTGRRKIKIEFIDDKSRRQITFSKRKAGLMKKAYELTTLTGTQALLLVASETGHVYTFATPKLQPFVTLQEGKGLIQACLNTPDVGRSESNQSAQGSTTGSNSANGGSRSQSNTNLPSSGSLGLGSAPPTHPGLTPLQQHQLLQQLQDQVQQNLAVPAASSADNWKGLYLK